MTRMWERGRLSRRKAVSAAALLIALLCAGWLVWGRPDPAAPSPSASASADIVAAMTASPSPSPTPTATPLASDSADPSASPSASPTQAPKATPKPTPTGLPDLYYHHFGVKTMPRCESDIKGYIEVLNAGNVTVPAGQVDILFTVTEGGAVTFQTKRTVPVALAPGEQYEIEVTFRFADPCPYERLRTWSHFIDPENEIQESNEGNNTDVLTWQHAYVDPTPTPPPTASPTP